MNRQITLHNVSRETLVETREAYQIYKHSMERYLDRLVWWNKKINLVSRDVSRETIREHVIHSLIPSTLKLFNEEKMWIDAGTGGGLPGIPLSIVLPEKRWILNDIVNKKVAALNQMIHHLDIQNARTASGSISSLVVSEGSGVISKHAFKIAPLLDDLSGRNWKKLILFKGIENAYKEIELVNERYHYQIFKFDFSDEEPFYDGKGIVVIENPYDD